MKKMLPYFAWARQKKEYIIAITATNDSQCQHNWQYTTREIKTHNNNGNEYSLSHFYDDLKKQ